MFEAAWNLKWADLKQDLIPIYLCTVIKLIISIVGVGRSYNLLTLEKLKLGAYNGFNS